MKKRSRLDLSPGAKRNKVQAGGFGAKSSPPLKSKSVKNNGPESGSGATSRAGAKASRHQSDGTDTAHASQASSVNRYGISSRAIIVTGTIVVTAAVLAFYLLRRR